MKVNVSVGNIPDAGGDHAEEGGEGADQGDGGGVVPVATPPPLNGDNI